MSFLSLTNVAKRYSFGATSIPALNGVSLQIEAGEFTVIWGRSGSGKSTLLNILATIDRPDAGDYRIEEKSVNSMSDTETTRLRQHQIGIIFQSFNLVPVMTALENVMLPGQLLGRRADPNLEAHARQLLAEVGVNDYANHQPDQLSGGQRQRVALARALINRPGLVIADEPTANLDSINSRRIIDLLAEMNVKHDTTFIFSTHDPVLIDSARRRIHLSDGRVESDTGTDIDTVLKWNRKTCTKASATNGTQNGTAKGTANGAAALQRRVN